MWQNSVCLILVANHTILGALLSSSFTQSRHVPGPATFPLTLRAAIDGITELRNNLDDSINSLLGYFKFDIWT